MVIFTSFLVYILESIFLLYDFSCFSPSASTLALYSCSILSLNKTQSLHQKSKIETSGQKKTQSLPQNHDFQRQDFPPGHPALDQPTEVWILKAASEEETMHWGKLSRASTYLTNSSSSRLPSPLTSRALKMSSACSKAGSRGSPCRTNLTLTNSCFIQVIKRYFPRFHLKDIYTLVQQNI